MGEVMNTADYDSRVSGWEVGLPSDDELMPLSQALIPPQLAMAFNIKPEPNRTSIDVDRAARETFASLRRGLQPTFAENSFKPFSETTGNNSRDLMIIVDVDEDDDERSDSRKIRRIEGMEEADSVSRGDNSNSMALKRPRLVWTPQLHRRFVDVVSHLGIKSAVPKTIMQMMNVEGLTRENVASHLQKYRLYLKRGNDSSSDQLFASTPVPQNLNLHDGSRNGQRNMSIPTPYGSGMVPVPMFGMRYGSHGMDHHIQHGYGMMQQMDWAGNSNGSVVSYPHAPHAGN